MNIGIDIDGVVYPWHDSIYRYFIENKGFEGSQREFWTKMNQTLTKEQWEYYVSIPMLYLDTSPRQDVLDYLPKIAELGTIYYITNRSPELKSVTSKFFNIFGLPFKENVIFTGNKATYVRLHNIQYFIDDRPENVDELLGITDAYLFKAVHNWEVREKYKLINTMKEFYELIKENDGKKKDNNGGL